MKIKLTRDEARAIQQNIFPYLVQVCDMKVRTTDYNQDENSLAKVVRCINPDIKSKFDRKLVTDAKKFSVSLKESEAIIFCRLLTAFPINRDNIWMLTLVQRLITELHQDTCKPELIPGTN